MEGYSSDMRQIILELDRALIASIMEDQGWELQRDLLHAYQDAGVGAHEVRDLLDELRAQVRNETADAAQAEIIDDRILDVLDIVTGWCSPSSRVWPALPA